MCRMFSVSVAMALAFLQMFFRVVVTTAMAAIRLDERPKSHFLGQQHTMDVRQHSAMGDSHASQQLA